MGSKSENHAFAEFPYLALLKSAILELVACSSLKQSSSLVARLHNGAHRLHVTNVPRLARECWVDTKNQPIQRFCVSDEHYTPTLLAYMGLDNETDCIVSLF